MVKPLFTLAVATVAALAATRIVMLALAFIVDVNAVRRKRKQEVKRRQHPRAFGVIIGTTAYGESKAVSSYRKDITVIDEAETYKL